MLAVSVAMSVAACYSTGDGTAPPTNGFYFPTGLAVSPGGTVLYAVNSDFDLQYNGGTLQSYDLLKIRAAAALNAASECDSSAIGNPQGPGRTKQLGETCAPPQALVPDFFRQSVIIGAFATDLQVARNGGRLFVPIRGDTSLTWADVPDDRVALNTEQWKTPFDIECGPKGASRCDDGHQAGNKADETFNSRKLTMPGEPFGMAQSEDGQYIAITHQASTKTSLFTSGIWSSGARTEPSIKFILDGVRVGGNGIVAIPSDPDAFKCNADLGFPCDDRALRPAFLQTTRAAPEVTLVRLYDDRTDKELASPAGTKPAFEDIYTLDEQGRRVAASDYRPFLVKEASYSITVNASGFDSRGIVIDPSPRIACKLRSPPEDHAKCARRPARVYIANRSPASLLIGDVGDSAIGLDGSYDATRVNIHTSVPLTFGPSRIYLAPIVDRDGVPALRVFIVCFDSSTLFIYDPDANAIENIVRLGPGPFAMAFDPFSIEEVVRDRFAGAPVLLDDRAVQYKGQVPTELRRYRFAYVASFTRSYLQVLDLDNARADKSTFEKVVFTLGQPTPPKGSR